jgi:hypothetical protein
LAELEELQFFEFSELPQRTTFEKVLLILGASSLGFDGTHNKGFVERGIDVIKVRGIALVFFVT